MSALRISYSTLAPQAYKALAGLNAALDQSSLGKPLIELLFMRISQMNGCVFCVDMHARELLKHGEDWQRMNSLFAWRETGFFSDPERAALAWAESLTKLTDMSDELFDGLKAHFSDKEIAELSFTVGVMNAWNRIAIGFRQPVTKAAMAV